MSEINIKNNNKINLDELWVLYENNKISWINIIDDTKLYFQWKWNIKNDNILNFDWWDFVLWLLIFLINKWISDLHIEANNSIVYRIRYRKDKKLFLVK